MSDLILPRDLLLPKDLALWHDARAFLDVRNNDEHRLVAYGVARMLLAELPGGTRSYRAACHPAA